jgi:diacylglycerol kinase (ATP)
MRHLFIVNPVAGGRDKSEEIRNQVSNAFASRRGEYEIYVTQAPLDACEKIRRAAAETSDELRVYACGGDGTLNECVNGAAGLPNVAVTHFPCGTGNDFIKLFGADTARFFQLEELLDGEIHSFDLIQCNDRYSLNICSVGIDARIGTGVHQYSHLPLCKGSLGYVASLVANVAKGITQELRVTCCGRTYTGDFSLVCVCNGQFYGGGFHPSTTARPDSGRLEFLLVKGVSAFQFFRLVRRYARGESPTLPQYVTCLSGASIRIEGKEKMVVNVDGEALWERIVNLRVHPGALSFITPSHMAFFENEQEKKRDIKE